MLGRTRTLGPAQWCAPSMEHGRCVPLLPRRHTLRGMLLHHHPSRHHKPPRPCHNQLLTPRRTMSPSRPPAGSRSRMRRAVWSCTAGTSLASQTACCVAESAEPRPRLLPATLSPLLARLPPLPWQGLLLEGRCSVAPLVHRPGLHGLPVCHGSAFVAAHGAAAAGLHGRNVRFERAPCRCALLLPCHACCPLAHAPCLR